MADRDIIQALVREASGAPTPSNEESLGRGVLAEMQRTSNPELALKLAKDKLMRCAKCSAKLSPDDFAAWVR